MFMKIPLFILCIVLLFISGKSRANNEVKVFLSVNPTNKTFSCEYRIIVDPKTKQQSFVFNLNNEFKIMEVSSKKGSKVSIKSYFDLFRKDTTKRVEVEFHQNSVAKREITIKYSGKVPDKSFTDNVIELSAHTNWLPYFSDREYEAVNYELEVTVMGNYKVISTREPIKHVRSTYTFKGIAPNVEITAMIATNLQKLTLDTKFGKILIYKASDNLKSTDTTLINHAKEIISYYNETIGKDDQIKNFTILMPYTNRNAFALLDNAINITYSNFNTNNLEDKLILAHEISHKWWAYGQWNDYNNWLNEAFATYSSLLCIKALGDTVTFKNEIYKRVESSANTPSIIGFNINMYDYKTIRKVMYDKGTVILFQLNEKMGDKKFLNFLSKVAGSKITTTERLLNLLEHEENKELRLWLDSELKI